MDAAFVWDDNFLTHIGAVDEQHHTLVELFNELSAALFLPEHQREATLADIYDRLLAYTNYHFREEEELMQIAGIDPRHQETHQHIHQQFVEQLTVLWAQRSAMRDPATTLVGFLTSWLGLHILGVDQSMARQIASMERGLSSAEAFERERQTHDEGTQALLKMIGRLYNVLSSQNAQLAEANFNLEERVALRTRELEEANNRLRAQSRTDAMLGIANRAYFNERLEQFWGLARRQRRPLALIMVDVDYFKRYNDHYGHLQGDACLQAVARALGGCLRRSADLLARYGGEELAVVLPDTAPSSALEVAQNLVQAVRDMALPHADSLVAAHVSISAGVCSMVPSDDGLPGNPAAALIACADAALYRAKESGRNRCVLGPVEPATPPAEAA